MPEHSTITAAAQATPAAVESGQSFASTQMAKRAYRHPNPFLPIQFKLSVGAVDDPLEHEADVMADTVMRMPMSGSFSSTQNRFIQRRCNHCEEEENDGIAQRKPLVSFIQKKENGKSEGPVNDAVSSQINATKGNGSGMDDQTQSFMESRFGTGFQDVRIHAGGYASELSQQLNAQAFTVGNDVYFNQGKYAPNTSEGKHLLAHELTHTIQQSGKLNKILRKVDEASVTAEFNAWADANTKAKNKDSKDFPWNVWDFIRPQILDASMDPFPKPKDKAGIEKWNDNFTKAEIIGGWLANIKNTAKDDNVKTDASSKIYYIGDAMAKAGLTSKAVAQAANTDNAQKALIYGTILKSPSSASASELETIFKFQMAGQTDPEQVDFIKTLSLTDGNALQKLDAAKTQAMFKVMIAAYGSNDKIVKAMAGTLIFNPAVRTVISDGMMNSTVGSPDLLFKILSHPYFKDSDYEGAVLINVPNNDIDKDNAKHWKDDLPYAIKYKQQYYVHFLIKLADKQGIAIKAPTDFKITTLKAWLDLNTENIAIAAAKEYKTDNNAIFDVYRNITDIFFYHIDHKDAVPDKEGKLAKLGTGGKPDKTRIEADCDVFAAYAMRLYNSAGFQPIGYLGLYPTGDFANRAAHASALIRKDNTYYIINNKNMFESGITETKPDEKKEEAIKKMKAKAIDDAYGDPKPTTWEIYYTDAGPKGEFPTTFLEKRAVDRRKDLE